MNMCELVIIRNVSKSNLAKDLISLTYRVYLYHTILLYFVMNCGLDIRIFSDDFTLITMIPSKPIFVGINLKTMLRRWASSAFSLHLTLVGQGSILFWLGLSIFLFESRQPIFVCPLKSNNVFSLVSFSCSFL